MPRIDTEIKIHAPVAKVWSVFMDFPSWVVWNPFIVKISGTAKEKEKLKITAKLPNGKGMTFKPAVLCVRENAEFRWRGSLPIPGLFTGEHLFLFKDDGRGGTDLTHSEIFSGLLPPFMPGMLAKTKQGFEIMNKALKERAER